MQKKRLAILGSTGSIGTQTLDIVLSHSGYFEVEVLTAHSNAKLLIEQAKKYQPNVVVIGNETHYEEVFHALDKYYIKVYSGASALEDVVTMDTVDLVVTALVGAAGLAPTVAALKAKKPIALANKETLVVAGELITKLSRETGAPIFPVDSEHSALLQCVVGETMNPIEKIILTASGGPFRGKTRSELASMRPEQALKHPNWTMGAKITIDSASLMNKCLEVIEAKWLFDLQPDQIEVAVHPQSIVHSMVQFQDGSVKAQMGLPDMKLPILYAMQFPKRLPTDWQRMKISDYANLTFQEVDHHAFPSIGYAYDCMKAGGNMACILNAANEIAVGQFLKGEIGFTDIYHRIESALKTIDFVATPDLQSLFATDAETRKYITLL